MSLQIPKVTCVTVCKNCKKDFQLTMKSILSQNFNDMEVVVIDGGSTDGTKEEILHSEIKFKELGINYIYLSEPDEGIYNAMNKGIDLANGKWLIFMNAGDQFASPEILKTFINREKDEYDVIYGDFYMLHPNGWKEERKSSSFERIEKSLITCHQAIFTKTSLMKERKFNEKYKIIADYEWYLNLYCNGGKFYYIPEFICIFDGTGISSTRNYEVFCECLAIRKEHGTLHNPELIIKLKKFIMYCRYLLK